MAFRASLFAMSQALSRKQCLRIHEADGEYTLVFKDAATSKNTKRTYQRTLNNLTSINHYFDPTEP